MAYIQYAQSQSEFLLKADLKSKSQSSWFEIKKPWLNFAVCDLKSVSLITDSDFDLSFDLNHQKLISIRFSDLSFDLESNYIDFESIKPDYKSWIAKEFQKASLYMCSSSAASFGVSVTCCIESSSI